MVISKIIRGLRGHPLFKEFATQYHLLRDIDPKFEELDHVITQLLTYESSHVPEPDLRRATPYASNDFGRQSYARNDYQSFRQSEPRQANRMRQREQCTACGMRGHIESTCWELHPELRRNNNNNNNGGQQRGPYQDRYNAPRNDRSNNGRAFRGKPNRIAAAAFVDNKGFVQSLRDAEYSASGLNNSMASNLCFITPANSYAQISRLGQPEGECKGKGEKQLESGKEKQPEADMGTVHQIVARALFCTEPLIVSSDMLNADHTVITKSSHLEPNCNEDSADNSSDTLYEVKDDWTEDNFFKA
jgi:hypothetical protein